MNVASAVSFVWDTKPDFPSLLALAFRALNVLGFEVWFRNGCGPDRFFPSVFEVVAKFLQRQSSGISPYFRAS